MEKALPSGSLPLSSQHTLIDLNHECLKLKNQLIELDGINEIEILTYMENHA